MLEMDHTEKEQKDFDPELYLKILIAIAKADPNNGPRESAFVQKQARRIGLDPAESWEKIDKRFAINKAKVSRSTALSVLRDCIILASLDGNFSLPEKERVYHYAEKMGISHADADHLSQWVREYQALQDRWRKLLAHQPL